MNHINKRTIISFFCIAVSFACIGCGDKKEEKTDEPNISNYVATVSSNYDKPVIPLDEDEKELLDLVAEDINAVTDDNYAQIVPELAAHTGEFSGMLYQIEGIYSLDGDTPFVYRTLVNGNKRTDSGLPLKYIEKSIEDGSWIRVTGVIQEGEVDGENMNILEVIAVESLSTMGQSELMWDGSAHSH